MTAVAAMLGLSVLMLQLLMRIDADSRSRLEAATSLSRLASRFRHDVHAAAKARKVEPPAVKTSALRMEQGPNRAIEYQAEGDGKIVRVETKDGKVLAHETYLLPRSGQVRMGLVEQDGHRFATLAVDRLVTKNRTDPVRQFEVLAQVGKNSDHDSGTSGTGGVKP
jgi:hypothetical protein